MDTPMAVDLSLDREIALRYVRYLLDHDVEDSPLARKGFCDEQTIHPKLLYHNPHIRDISALFTPGSSFERLRSMTLQEWALYHHHYVHQAYRYGDPEMQQRWLGHDILKSPFDCWVYQEILFRVRPDVVLELGVMFGGASHYLASILDLVGHGMVLGVDISLAKVRGVENQRIEYIEGGSTEPMTFERVRERIDGKRVMVIADSDHEKDHVLRELRLYAPFVSVGSYYVVEDSLNDAMRWHPVPNEGPQAAAVEYVRENPAFVPDVRYAERYILTLNPLGFLLRVREDGTR
jgi:cephalosporin hydroxylase